jgi:hypothetical protein
MKKPRKIVRNCNERLSEHLMCMSNPGGARVFGFIDELPLENVSLIVLP